MYTLQCWTKKVADFMKQVGSILIKSTCLGLSSGQVKKKKNISLKFTQWKGFGWNKHSINLVTGILHWPLHMDGRQRRKMEAKWLPY